LNNYINIALIIFSLTLIGLVIMQAKGSQWGSIFGSDAGVYRTRRGVERTIFNLTIVVSVLFLITASLSAFLG
jgi:preprotein translocase subunit SecG